MTQYISKDALVTEIEKTINEPYPKHDQQCDWEDGYCSGLYKALNIIENTIEVKEVDLEKEASKWQDKVYLECGCEDSYGTPQARLHHIGDAFIAGAEFMIKVQKGE